MVEYSNQELAEMHFIYGLCNGNALESVRTYAARYPNRRQPIARTFTGIHRRLCEAGTFVTRRERGSSAGGAAIEERVLREIRNNPTSSTRMVEKRIGFPKSTVWNVLHSDNQHPYHFTPVQTINAEDKVHRKAYCEAMLLRNIREQSYLGTILWTDEAQFTRDGVTNFHNLHYWCTTNPHCKKEVKSHHRFSVNVWMGIIGKQLIGPYIIEGNQTGDLYLNFLANILPGLLEAVPLNIRSRLTFQQDGVPSHFRLSVRAYLEETFGERWIGRGGPTSWPPRSPDLTPLDFYAWGFIKDNVYQEKILSREHLLQRITLGAEKLQENLESIDINLEISKRLQICKDKNGDHFEIFL